jgi:cell division protein FtsB
MQGIIVRVAFGVFGVLSVFILLLAVFNENGALAVHRRRVKLEAFEEENRRNAKENEDLAVEIQALKSDPFRIEAIAREEYGQVRPGEVIFELAAPAKN